MGYTSSEGQAGFIEKCHLDHKEPNRAFLSRTRVTFGVGAGH